MKQKKFKLAVFDIVNYTFFILFSIIILAPFWKVLVDSVNSVGVYQFTLLPSEFTLKGYITIFTSVRLYRPFFNSVISTIAGTMLGLVLSTLGGYVLTQKDLPGRSFMSMFLLFTMIFSGGMIPEYLVMKQLHLVNTIWVLVIRHGMSVYNVILMKNFFEDIPESLIEAAKIDGCSPTQLFFKVVLPLSKAALASIGLMYAVAVWNDYSTVQVFIADPDQVNFQYKLKTMVMDGDTPGSAFRISQNTIFNAAIVCTILPFLVAYPFLQRYFVRGVNAGAVKE